MDISDLLLPEHRDKGIRLLEADDHIAELLYEDEVIGRYMAINLRKETIWKDANEWLKKQSSTAR